MVKIPPEVNKIDTIKLAQPDTSNPSEIDLNKTKKVKHSAKNETKRPKITEKIKGRSENDNIISVANLILFRIVYEGLPLNRFPCFASIAVFSNPNHFIELP